MTHFLSQKDRGATNAIQKKYYYDGYILYPNEKTLYFGITSDDDSFLWIIKGDKKWSNINHPDAVSYTYIVNNITDATLVCSHPGNHGTAGNYQGSRFGQYTFEANTLYSILIKFTEHGGGAAVKTSFSDNSLQNQSSNTTPFPIEFGSVKTKL